MNKHILIVEDEAILYDRLSRLLLDNNYSVDEYTPSVADAYERIIERKPDLVLLDINLQGKKTGVDLGKTLYKNLKIPFIYVTDVSDPKVFEKALNSMPNLYLIKTKPFLNKKELLLNIQIVLKSTVEKNKVVEKRKGMFLFTDYMQSIKENNIDPNYRELVNFDEVLLVEVDLHKNKFNNTSTGTKNYVRLTTRNGSVYYYNNSLSNILQKLPKSFKRISRGVALNCLHENIKGKSNHTSITLINDETYYIGNTYKNDIEKLMNEMFAI